MIAANAIHCATQLKPDLLTVYFASGFGDRHSNGIEYGRSAIEIGIDT
jgi:hypothetical protein